jgi:hypothetical protein
MTENCGLSRLERLGSEEMRDAGGTGRGREEGRRLEGDCNSRDRCWNYVPDLFDRHLHNLVPTQLKRGCSCRMGRDQVTNSFHPRILASSCIAATAP